MAHGTRKKPLDFGSNLNRVRIIGLRFVGGGDRYTVHDRIRGVCLTLTILQHQTEVCTLLSVKLVYVSCEHVCLCPSVYMCVFIVLLLPPLTELHHVLSWHDFFLHRFRK